MVTELKAKVTSETRIFKPDNITQLTPYLTVTNADEAIQFYRKAFGFNLVDRPVLDDNNKAMHAHMYYGDAHIMFATENAWDSTKKTPKSQKNLTSPALYVYCPNVDDFFENAKINGATVTEEPKDQFWGDRTCTLLDPSGHEWIFATFMRKQV
jgi:uncharacterized glyoxalase superfamily protein PhnB